jgi:hypothetical protein
MTVVAVMGTEPPGLGMVVPVVTVVLVTVCEDVTASAVVVAAASA